MSLNRFRYSLFALLVCGVLTAPVIAPAQTGQSSTTDASAPTTIKDQDASLKNEEKANKERAKAAKAQRKALRAQDKAAKADKKAGAVASQPTAPPQ